MAAKPTNNNSIMIGAAVIIVAALVILFNAYFLVPQGQFALKFRFGEVVRDSQTKQAIAYGPGLHWKIPFINTTKTMDARLRDMNVKTDQVFTEDNQPVNVDYYVAWKIQDLAKYYTTTGDRENDSTQFGVEESAPGHLIQQVVNSQLRNLLGDEKLRSAVTKNRQSLMVRTLQSARNPLLEKYGIKLEDFRIIRIELADSTLNRVYDAMIKNRESEREKYISEGKATNITIRSKADSKFVTSVAAAQAEAQNTRADADKEAANVYNNGFKITQGKDKGTVLKGFGQDEKFFAFYRSLIAYSHVFAGKNSIMVLKPNDQFLKYFSNESASPKVGSMQTKR